MAACLQIKVLQDIAFDRIQALLGKEEAWVLSREFVADLFIDDIPDKRLERCIMRHCAFHLKAGELVDFPIWSRSL
jgi:hypothetical protein